MDYGKLLTQRRELANTPELWQFDLLSPQEFCQFAKDRGVPVFDAGTVINLWRLGLLRADLIRATRELKMPSLELVSADDGVFTYCDERQVAHRDAGYGGAFATTE